MKPITQQEITDYVEVNVQSFHQKRLDSLQKLKLMDVVKRKNPYLFKAKNVNTASEFVMTILDAFLSSQEEGIFGGFLEEYAKVVNKFTAEFIGTFCDAEGNMLWEEIVKFNSAETAP